MLEREKMWSMILLRKWKECSKVVIGGTKIHDGERKGQMAKIHKPEVDLPSSCFNIGAKKIHDMI